MNHGGATFDIEGQERAGQRDLVVSDLLPKRGSIDAPDARAQFPKGWERRATDHAMWSEICDPLGRVRLKVFYKAAFYDRRARLHPMPRYESAWDDPEEIVVDNATGRELIRVSDVGFGEPNEGVAGEWLRDHISDPLDWDFEYSAERQAEGGGA